MREAGADVGFVVDPDVDRLAIVMENGEMFIEENTLIAIADYVLGRTPGNTVSNRAVRVVFVMITENITAPIMRQPSERSMS